MAVSPVLAAVQGVMQGIQANQQNQPNPLAMAEFQLQADNMAGLQQYRQSQIELNNLAAQARQRELQAYDVGQSANQFADFDAFQMEQGGFGNALRTPTGQSMFLRAYNNHPEREALGLGRVDGLEIIDEANFGRWGFTPDQFEAMRRQKGSTAMFVPFQLDEQGRKVPMLEDIDGDGVVEAYGDAELEQMVRPFMRTASSVAGDFAALQGGGPLGGTATRDGGQMISAPPGQFNPGYDMAAYSESGNNPAAISSGVGDPGGKSYGRHQLSSNTGTLDAFLRSPEGRGYAGALTAPVGSGEFDAQFRSLANTDPNFSRAQEAFLNRTHTQPVVGRAQELGIPVENEGVRQALRSQSIQHSFAGNDIILQTAMQNVGPDATPEDMINAIYDARTDYAMEHLDDPDQRRGVLNRYRRERQQTLRMAQQSASEGGVSQAQGAQPQVDQTAVQAAVDVATGFDSQRIPSLVERATTPDPTGQGMLNTYLRERRNGTSMITNLTDRVVDSLSTGASYVVGSDNLEALSEAINDNVKEPLDRLTAPARREVAEALSSLPPIVRNALRLTVVGEAFPDALKPGSDELQHHRTGVGRRIGEGKTIGPGTAKRNANNTEALDDVAASMTPVDTAMAADTVLSGIQQRGNSFSVTSTSGKPTHQQITKAYSLKAQGLISDEEFKRFVDTGTISADGVTVIRQGMQDAAGLLEQQISQEGQTARNAADNQRMVAENQLDFQQAVALEQIKNGNGRDNRSVVQMNEDMNALAPNIWGDLNERQQRKGITDLNAGLFQWGNEWLAENDLNTSNAMHGYRVLQQREQDISTRWYELYDRVFDEGRNYKLTEDPTAQALAARGAGVFDTPEGSQQYAKVIGRFKDMLNGMGQQARANDARFRTQVLLNYDTIVNEFEDLDWSDVESPTARQALQQAVRLASEGRSAREFVQPAR